MSFLRRAILYLIPLVRVLAFSLAGLLAALGVIRGVVWALPGGSIAPGVSGPEVFLWQEDDPWFGGVSALIMAPGGKRLLAGSDRGRFIETELIRGPDGRITGTRGTKLTPVSLTSGLPPTNFKMDFEALSPLPDGRVAQAFEGFVRIETLEGPTARPVPTHAWDRFAWAFGNEAFEALATLPQGGLLAITEEPITPGHAGTVVYDGKRWRRGPPLPLAGRFRVAGADVGPDGCLYITERRFGVFTGFTFRLRRLSGGAQGWRDDLLYTSPMARLGNAEAVSAWTDPQGRLVLSVVNDDNYLPLQPTRLMEFRLPPGACSLQF